MSGRLAELDAVTIDAHGTLVELDEPVPSLQAALASHGVEREEDAVARAFRAEVAYYRARVLDGADATSLADLRLRCAGVFLAELGRPLEPEAFVDSFVAAIRFRCLPGVQSALARLGGLGLALGVVSNWDVGLHDHLEALGLRARLACVVTSAEAGAAKPAPGPFALALARLGVPPGRALHVGDGRDDEAGARAAGMAFAAAPLAGALGAWA